MPTREFLYSARARRILLRAGVALGLVVLVGLAYGALPPSGTPAAAVRVEPGSSVREIGVALEEARVVRSGSAFSVLVSLVGAESSLVAGTYAFPEKEGLFSVVGRLRRGETLIPMAEVTLPEGVDRREMARLLVAAMPEFPSAEFLRLTEGEEGYLFPDTYRFEPDATATVVADVLRDTFRRRTNRLLPDVAASGRSLADVVKMASIVEREATADSRAIVAGILWGRLDAGMALQVDAPFVYAIGRDSSSLTKEDLERDGPYNTYTRRGFPPTPIGNPGLAAMEAAIHPEESDYVYFLTGKDGQMHYAKTFAEHVRNKERYL